MMVKGRPDRFGERMRRPPLEAKFIKIPGAGGLREKFLTDPNPGIKHE